MGGGQALNGGLLAVLGWDNEILARKFSKIDCRDWQIMAWLKSKIFTSWKGHFWPKKADGFSSHLGGGGGGLEQVWHLSQKKWFFFLKASLRLIAKACCCRKVLPNILFRFYHYDLPQMIKVITGKSIKDTMYSCLD